MDSAQVRIKLSNSERLKYIPSSVSARGSSRDGNVSNFMQMGRKSRSRTTAASVHLSVRAEFYAVDGTVVTFEDFPLFAIHSVHANPFVAGIACYEPVLQDWMDRSRRGRVGESKTVCGSPAIRRSWQEAYGLARC